VAVASAGPHANHLHLASDRLTMPAPHRSIFYRADAPLDAKPTVQSTGGTTIYSLKIQHHQNDGIPGEIPDGNSTSNDKLLACKNELHCPHQSNQMYPPEMSRQSISFKMNAFKTPLITNVRSS